MTHKYDKIETVAEELSKSIDEKTEQATSRVECLRGITAQDEISTVKMLNDFRIVEQEVKDKGERVKQLIAGIVDGQVSDLLQYLQSLKSAAEIEMKVRADTLQLALTKLESFRTSLSELRSKGSPSDITQAANDVHERAEQLFASCAIPTEYRAPSYKFAAVDIDELIRDDQNLVGHVVEVEVSGKIVLF